jgi:hypothetical protein
LWSRDSFDVDPNVYGITGIEDNKLNTKKCYYQSLIFIRFIYYKLGSTKKLLIFLVGLNIDGVTKQQTLVILVIVTKNLILLLSLTQKNFKLIKTSVVK